MGVIGTSIVGGTAVAVMKNTKISTINHNYRPTQFAILNQYCQPFYASTVISTPTHAESSRTHNKTKRINFNISMILVIGVIFGIATMWALILICMNLDRTNVSLSIK